MSEPRVALLHLAFEDYAATVANELAGLVDLTLVHPVQIADRMQNRLRGDVAVETFDKPRFRNPRNVFATPALIRTLRTFDLVHVQQLGDPWVDLGLIALGGTPLVVTVHDVVPHTGDGDRIPGSHAVRRFMHRRASAFIVHSDDMRTQLIEEVGPKPSVVVVQHPSMRSLWVEGAPSPSPGNRHEVLFFGRIWPYKGLDVLVEAMGAVRGVVEDARLVVAGRGDDLSRIFPSGPPEWVELHNRFIEHEEIPDLFEHAAVVALPYRDATQSGVGVMAADFNRPVVASSVGGLKSLFAGPTGGLLVPPESPRDLAAALVTLLGDDDVYARKQGELESIRERLAPSRMARSTADLYRSVLG